MDGEILNILHGQCGEDELSDIMPINLRSPSAPPLSINKGIVPRPGNKKDVNLNGVNSQLPDAFSNDRDPEYYLSSETHKHRLIVYLAACGKNMKEIAESVNMGRKHVSNILRQPWARQRLIEEIRDNGRDVIKTILEPAAHDALLTVVDLSRSATKEDVKLRASQELLDRFLGKSTQVVQASVSNLDKLTDEQLEAIANRGRSGNGRAEGVGQA